jgi:hypothetical protein
MIGVGTHGLPTDQAIFAACDLLAWRMRAKFRQSDM